MKSLLRALVLSIACGGIIQSVGGVETFFGPGAFNVASNESIVISTFVTGNPSPPTINLTINGNNFLIFSHAFGYNPKWAIAGPSAVVITNQLGVTFQRLKGSVVKTCMVTLSETNELIDVPTNKVIQIFAPMHGTYDFRVFVKHDSSTNLYEVPFYNGSFSGVSAATLAGPATISFTTNSVGLISYYLSDVSSGDAEVNIQKSYDLTNWITTGAFNTDAEPSVFYRLKILK